MNRYLLLVGLFLSALAGRGCSDDTLQGSAPKLEHYYQGPSDTPAAPDQWLPLPDSDQLAVDFGEQEVGTIVHRYLFLRNSGSSNLVMGAISIDPASSADFLIACRQGGIFRNGCPPTPEPPRASPGQDLVLQLSYAPATAGPDSGRIVLTFNTSHHSSLTLLLSGSGVERVIDACVDECIGSQQAAACQGAPLLCQSTYTKGNLPVDFGETPIGSDAFRRVLVRNLGQLALRVSGAEMVAGSAAAFSLDLSGSGLPGVLGGGGETEFQVHYRPTLGEEHRGRLRIASDDIRRPELIIELAGQGLAPRVCVNPTSLDFGTVPTGQPVVKSFALENCGRMPLQIFRVALAANPFSPDFSLVNPAAAARVLQPGEAVAVEVQYLPGSDGSDAGGVDIFSDDMVSDPVSHYTGTVLLTGRGLSQVCNLDPQPAAVQFGPVEIGANKQNTLVLGNSGNGPCIIESVVISANTAANEFVLDRAPPSSTTIPPGGQETVQLSYHPADHGADTGILSVLANDKDAAETKIDLNAFGTWPGGQGPVAVCSVSPTQALPLTNVTWRGDQSYDTNNRPLSEYRWTVVSFPAGSAARLLGTGANRYSQVDLAGSYTAQLVVVNDIGQVSQPCQATTTVTPTQDLWIEMYWAHNGDDMDLHLLAPGGVPRTSSDCFFANCVGQFFTPDWGQLGYDGDDPHLDMDDIPGTGPENINIADPADGKYTVFVHDYPGSIYDPANHVTVNVYIDGALVATFQNDLSGEDFDWYVCEIDWPSGMITPL